MGVSSYGSEAHQSPLCSSEDTFAPVQSNISAQLTADMPVWSLQLDAAGLACGEGVIGFQRTGSSRDCPTPPPS